VSIANARLNGLPGAAAAGRFAALVTDLHLDVPKELAQ